MPRIPLACASLPAVLLGALLWTPTASAHPDPQQLDHRRADLLDEMADRLARWKTQPRASSDAPAKTRPEAGTDTRPTDAPPRAFEDVVPIADARLDDSDGITDGSDGIRSSPDDTKDGMNGTTDDSHIIPCDSDDIQAQAPLGEAGGHADRMHGADLAGERAIDSTPFEPAPVAAAPALPEPAPLPRAPALPAPPELEPDDDSPSLDGAPSSLDAPLPLGRHDARAISLAVLAETNAARARHGLPPVEAHPILDAAAIEFAEHLARTGQFGHIDLTRPGMEEPSDRVRAAGGTDVLAAENLITETWLQVDGGEQMFVVDEARHRYSRTPGGPLIPAHTTRTIARSMVQRWLESPGHRRNILDAEGRQMGFGMAWDPRAQIPSLVAVQVFQRYHPLGQGPKLR